MGPVGYVLAHDDCGAQAVATVNVLVEDAPVHRFDRRALEQIYERSGDQRGGAA